MQKLKAVLAFIDKFNYWVGKIASLIIIPLILIIVFEVVMRYAFDMPTIWVNEFSWYLWGALFVFGGAYAAKVKAHVSVDILTLHLSPRWRAILSLFTTWFAFLFLFIIVWKGVELTMISLSVLEKSHTTWAPVVYPMKMMIPIGGFFMFMQTLAWYIRDIVTAITGEEKL